MKRTRKYEVKFNNPRANGTLLIKGTVKFFNKFFGIKTNDIIEVISALNKKCAFDEYYTAKEIMDWFWRSQEMHYVDINCKKVYQDCGGNAREYIGSFQTVSELQEILMEIAYFKGYKNPKKYSGVIARFEKETGEKVIW